MAGNLKGLTVQIGGDATPLGNALSSIKQKLSATKTELATVNNALKFDPSNTVLLAQKQSVLAERIAATKEKLVLLKQAQEQAEAALKNGEISESDYRQLERDIIAATKQLTKLESEAQKTENALHGAGDGAKDTAKGVKEVGQEAETSEKKASSFGDVLKGTLASQAIMSGLRALKTGIQSIFTGINESAQALGTLSDDAAKVGMSAESLQAWEYAAKTAGLENEQLIKSMVKQQTAFAKAKSGNAGLADSYALIGVDISTLTSAEGAFEAVINGLASCEDETTRNTVANALFGRSYADLAPLLSAGAAGISDLRQRAYDLGIVISNDAVNAGDALADEFDTLGIMVDATKAKLVSGMVPALHTYTLEAEKALSGEKTQKSLQSLGKSIGELTGKALSLATTVLPKLADGMAFATKNGKDLAIAAAAGAVAINGFTIASKAKSLIDGMTTAFQGFSAAIAANPVGLLITSISTLVAVMSVANACTDTAVEQQERLAESYKESALAAEEVQKTRAQAGQALNEEYDHYRDLVAELDTVVDANGRVKAGYEERAAYITGALSAATGVEIELVDGVISRYHELAASIDDVITKKQAEAYITSNQGGYESAKAAVGSGEKDADGNYVAGSQAAAEEARANYQIASDTYDQLISLENKKTALQQSHNPDEFYSYQAQLDEIDRQIIRTAEKVGVNATTSEIAIQSASEYVDSARATAEAAAYAYDQNRSTIAQFEEVQTAVWSDNAEAIAEALETATSAQMTAATATLSSLERQRQQALEEYNMYLEWSKEANSTVTAADVSSKRTALIAAAIEAHKRMLMEGNQHTQAEIDASRSSLESLLSDVAGMSEQEITKLIASAEKDATKAGGSYVEGIVNGIVQNQRQAYLAGYNLAQQVDKGYRAGSKTNSPSKVGEESGGWYPVGVAKGIAGRRKNAVAEAVLLAEQIDAAMRGGMPQPTFAYTMPNADLYQHFNVDTSNADFAGINSRLDRLLGAVNAISLVLAVDGRVLSDALAPHTDATLGARAQNERRDALS